MRANGVTILLTSKNSHNCVYDKVYVKITIRRLIQSNVVESGSR